MEGAALDALFEISITPASQNADVNEDAFYTVQVDPLEGFTGGVFLDVTTDPPFSGFVHMVFGFVTPPDTDFLDAHGDCDTVPGTYTLTVTGTGDDGSTATANASLTVDPTTFPPPNANISVSCNNFTCQFFDSTFGSSCTNMVAWEWDFGDGSVSNQRNPLHTYAARGDYTVTLKVTDDQGLSDEVAEEITVFPPPPVLEIVGVSRRKEVFEFRVDLAWSGAEGDLVELRRNFFTVDLPDNDGAYRDRFRTLDTSFQWEVCELGLNFCSNEVSINFGPNLNAQNAVDAIVSTAIDGRTIVRKVRIQDE